jgi:hypothetical protein
MSITISNLYDSILPVIHGYRYDLTGTCLLSMMEESILDLENSECRFHYFERQDNCEHYNGGDLQIIRGVILFMI